MLKKIVLSTVIICFAIFYGCGSKSNQLALIAERGEVVVAMDVDMPGYFVLNGEGYGYQYDLIKAYADQLGVSLKIVNESSPATGGELLKSGEVNMVASLTSHVAPKDKKYAVDIYSTSYVILTRKGHLTYQFDRSSEFSLHNATRNHTLMVSSAFKTSDNYEKLVDSLQEAKLLVSSQNSFDLIEQLSSGKFEYLICEKSEAQLGCALVRNVTQVYEFAEKIPMSIVISDNKTKASFEKWFNSYRNGEEYALLNELYFEKGIVGQLIGKGMRNNAIGQISTFDEVIKRVSGEQGFDWRLISAIAYSESRFNPYVISSQGAKGLMQIMPIVARQFNVEQHEVMKPEVNVLLATKLLTRIERSLKFPKHIAYNDRMKIILACYNGGIGHVSDARSLASKYGENPNSWDVVSRYLKLKADPQYNNDEVVKCGSFKGSGQTLAFVNKVMNRYTTYCNNIKL